MNEVDIVRRVIKSASKSTEPDERRLAQIMINKLDESMEKLSPRDVQAGDPVAGVEALTNARGLWHSVRKSEIIEDMMDVAETNGKNFTGAGLENAIRIEFRKLGRNKRKMRTFNKQEQKAIKLVGRSGTVDNIARFVGKAAPTGIVSGALSGGAGFQLGGPVGAVALPLAGAVGRRVATKRTGNNADAVRALVRGQNPKKERLTVQRAKTALEKAIGNPLLLKESAVAASGQ